MGLVSLMGLGGFCVVWWVYGVGEFLRSRVVFAGLVSLWGWVVLAWLVSLWGWGASGKRVAYQRRLFCAPSISSVPEKPVFAHRVPQNDASRTVGGRFRYRISLPYPRSLF